MFQKKVLINAIGARTGGAETFLTNLLPLLVEYCRELQFVLVIRQSRYPLYERLANEIEIHIIPDSSVSSSSTRLFFDHWQIVALHRRYRPALHFQSDEMLSPMVTWRNVPTVAVFHSTPMVLFGNVTGDGYLFERYARLIRWHTAKFATVPVTVSYHAKAELSGLFPFARERFRTIYHGVDQVRYCPGPQRTNPVSSYGIEPPYLLSVSNRFAWKNYYRLIQAYHKLVADHEIGYDLVLLGKAKLATEEERITSYLEQHGLNKRVHLVDYIEQSSLPDVYRGAVAYIFPSLRETFGLTVLEAMACGIPVACARWGPLPEVTGDAVCYFDPMSIDEMANAMVQVCQDESLRTELVKRGLEHVRYFTWERAAQQYKTILTEIIGC